jgi:sugar lactone lactonase YvrE
MRPLALALALPVLFTATPSAVADCFGEVSVVIDFDESIGELPEGVAVDVYGDVYVGVATTGEILKVDGGQITPYASLDVGAGYALGMATDGPGTLFVVMATFTPGTQGVYRISQGGNATMIAEFDAATTLPDDVVLGYDGYLYVTEAIGGAIHRIDAATYESELWFQDDLLVGDLENSPLPFPVGANGLALDWNSLVVSNTQMGRLVRIPIDCDGDPGDPEVILEDPLLHGADGVVLDSQRNIYVAVNDPNIVVRVSPDGEDVDVIADASDGLDFPASLAFGRGYDRKSLYITNFAFYSGASGNPALLKTKVPYSGKWLP